MTLLSLVVPTTGKPKNLYRCLDSIVNNAPKEMLKVTELIICLNPVPEYGINPNDIRNYINTISVNFFSVDFRVYDDFKKTAEESALEATSTATGTYLWITGDARIYLPEGLNELFLWLENPDSNCAFFNSIWLHQTKLKAYIPSLYSTQKRPVVPYKKFVMYAGINYIPTAFGAFIIDRKYLDRDMWADIIKNCGPHFSHVIMYLAKIQEDPITFFSTFLYNVEPKAYHEGDASEWDRYAKITNTYRYYAWSLGLVLQMSFLISEGVYSYADVRKSMCCEGQLLRRQVDEIYHSLLLQFRRGWGELDQRIKSDEFILIYDFLSRSCPEKAILNNLMREAFNCYESNDRVKFSDTINRIFNAIDFDIFDYRLSTLIVAQIGGVLVRLHPQGYIVSPIDELENLRYAYRLVDPPHKHKSWTIFNEYWQITIPQDDLHLTHLYPSESVPTPAPQRTIRRLAFYLYHNNFIFYCYSKMPNFMKSFLKKLVR